MSNTAASGQDRSESTDVAIGRRVRDLMWDRRLTAKSLAGSIGVDPTGLGRRLRGERGWSADEIKAAARTLSVSVGYLFDEESAPITPTDAKKATRGGARGGLSLPDLDSNQEPAGSWRAPVTHLIPTRVHDGDELRDATITTLQVRAS
jgi:transcriptional regulator with XRE-family HTH domain